MSFVPDPRDAPRPPTPPKPTSAIVKALRNRKRSRERTQPTYCPPKGTPE